MDNDYLYRIIIGFFIGLGIGVIIEQILRFIF